LLRAVPRAVAAPRRTRLLRPHRLVPDRPLLAVLDLGLAPVPRTRDPRPPRLPARLPGRARRGGARARALAAHALPAAEGRAHGRAPRGLRGRPHPRVVPLSPVVLPLRVPGARRAAAGGGGRAGGARR